MVIDGFTVKLTVFNRSHLFKKSDTVCLICIKGHMRLAFRYTGNIYRALSDMASIVHTWYIATINSENLVWCPLKGI